MLGQDERFAGFRAVIREIQIPLPLRTQKYLLYSHDSEAVYTTQFTTHVKFLRGHPIVFTDEPFGAALKCRRYVEKIAREAIVIHPVTSRFRRDADEICPLLGYYAASSGNPLPPFTDNESVPSSKFKKSKRKSPQDIIQFMYGKVRPVNGEQSA
jgi:hypothetical protein